MRQDYSFFIFFIFLSETRAAGFLSSLFSALAAVGALGVTFLSAILITSSVGPGSVEPFTSMGES